MSKVDVLFILFALLFSLWLMFSNFSYQDGSILIAGKAWSDFGGHIPLIRSFSLGDNIPPQYPLFPGEPIRYHFIFYALVGLLEKVGIRIDYALNIPSMFGFAGLLFVLYIFAKNVFKSVGTGILTVLFFLFNGTLSFVEFFKDHPVSTNTISDIISNNTFSSFAPYGKGIVSAFWNLNIYTNQRHLAAAYGLSFLFLFLLLKPQLSKKRLSLVVAAILGIVLGLSFFFHMAVFVMHMLVLFGMFLLFPSLRLSIGIIGVVAGLIALPQYLTLYDASGTSSILFHPGYLIQKPVTVLSFVTYWFHNFGLHLIFIPLGFLLAPKNAKKLLLCFLPIFIVGNLFQFSLEIAANHKFFNYFMLVGYMFSAFFLVFLWRKHIALKPLVVLLFFLLTFSGIIDFFPVYNDVKGSLSDYQKNQDVAWIMKNTPPDAVILNTNYFFHPASLAGRKIFLGWPYFAWSQGYDTNERDRIRKAMLSGASKEYFCKKANENDISYISIEQIEGNEGFSVNTEFFETYFPKLYQSSSGRLTIYAVKPSC